MVHTYIDMLIVTFEASYVILYLSNVEVQELHHQAMGAPVGDLRRALHEVVVRRAQPFEHVTLSPERAVIFRAALEELQSHRGSVKDGDSAVNHATTASSNLEIFDDCL